MTQRPPLRVLCIDDDEDILALFDLALTRTIAADVASARSSGEAVALLASGQRPDVILLDINLAGESGADVARRLADEGGHPRIPIIVVSGTGPVEIDGAIGYIAKPFDPMTVGDEILTRLEASSRDDSTSR